MTKPHHGGTLERARATITIATVAISACLLAACGGGSGDASSGDEVASLGTTPPTGTTPADSTADGATAGGTTADGTTPGESAPDGSDAEAPEDPEEAMLAFTECMRENGIDLPDPQFGEGEMGAVAVTIGPGDVEEMEAAQEECAPLMENARGSIELDPEQQAELEAEMLEFAQCMRDHGIEMQDPTFADDGGVMINMSAGSVPDGAGPGPRDDDEFQAAAEECGGPGGGPGVITNVNDGGD
jgi:hypothetical protein